jgi:hypothetical protein
MTMKLITFQSTTTYYNYEFSKQKINPMMDATCNKYEIGFYKTTEEKQQPQQHHYLNRYIYIYIYIYIYWTKFICNENSIFIFFIIISAAISNTYLLPSMKKQFTKSKLPNRLYARTDWMDGISLAESHWSYR